MAERQLGRSIGSDLGDHGRLYLVERHLESKAALDALVADYLATSRRRGALGAVCPTGETLAEGAGD